MMETFNVASKSGPGVYIFRFKRKKSAPRKLDDKDDNVIYLGSEVTDDNGILDVTYRQWKAPEEHSTSTTESQIWKPVHDFSSGRVAMIAVQSLLDRGYKMKAL